MVGLCGVTQIAFCIFSTLLHVECGCGLPWVGTIRGEVGRVLVTLLLPPFSFLSRPHAAPFLFSLFVPVTESLCVGREYGKQLLPWHTH